MTPIAVVAQSARIPRVGVLVPSNPEFLRSSFRDAFKGFGYIDGSSIVLEFRSADGNLEKLAGLANELVLLKVDVIVAFQTPAAHAAKQATTSIPIVILVADAVDTGLIGSLARPGGNVTGVSTPTAQLAQKSLELIREILPRSERIAVLANATDPYTPTLLQQLDLGARGVGLIMQTMMVRGAADYEAAFAAMQRERVAAYVHQPSLPRRPAIALALQHRLPSISPFRAFAEEGGLLSYAQNSRVNHRDAAAYVDKILKGRKPADLPVQEPTKFELLLNQRTARQIGLTIPASIIGRADEVIE